MNFISRIHKRRTLLVTMTFVLLSFLLMLNVMVNQLQTSDVIDQTGNGLNPEFVIDSDMELGGHYLIAKSQRQPKAAIERIHSDSDSGQNTVVNEGHIKVKDLSVNTWDHLHETLRIKSHNNNNRHNSQKTNNVAMKLRISNIHKNNIVPNNKDAVGNESDEYDDNDEDIENLVIEEEEEEDYDEDEEDENDEIPETNSLKVNHPVHLAPPKDNFVAFTKPPLQYKEVPDKKSHFNSQGHLEDNAEADLKLTDIVEDGIYWSSSIEQLVPKGHTFQETLDYISSVREGTVQSLDPPAWDRCGRPKNGFVTLEDGRHMCARYRDPHNKMVLGEVLSFYLSRLLGLDNVPAVVLSQTNQTKWASTNFSTVDWKHGKIVALIQWIPNMDSSRSLVKIPQFILNKYEEKSVITPATLENSQLTPTLLSELFQWGGMILFDYLTGNYDRIASMQDAAYKERKPSILAENIRNLRKSIKTSKLWLIDNESGLLDAYDLMYQNGYGGDKFIKFHRDMLQTFCVFPKTMVESLVRLNTMLNPEEVLLEFAEKHEPLLDVFPKKDSTFRIFQKRFRERVSEVSDWIQTCRSKSADDAR